MPIFERVPTRVPRCGAIVRCLGNRCAKAVRAAHWDLQFLGKTCPLLGGLRAGCGRTPGRMDRLWLYSPDTAIPV